MGGERSRRKLGSAVEVAPGTRVDKFEIFFDLVFVVSFFIITRATAASVTGQQLLQAVLVLSVLWWCWVVHSMLATRIRLGEGYVPVAMVAGMAALFAFALALPQAFGNPRDGPGGPLLVAVSYLVIRSVHLVLYLHAAPHGQRVRRRLMRAAPEIVVTTLLLVAAALLPAYIDDPGRAVQVRDGLWILVVLVQYGSGLTAGTSELEITSAEHWTERYDLILIIALGESVISVGVGGNLLGKPVTWPAILAAMLGILFTAALWWAHFDLVGPAARLALHATRGRPRVTMARDAYAYLYLPMIAGVILFAIGAEQIVQAITDPGGGPAVSGPPSAVPLLFCGVILYLAADLAFQLRTLHTVTWTRIGVLAALAAGLPLAQRLSALGALALLTLICVALVVAELVLLADSRRALHEAVLAERFSNEASDATLRAGWHDDRPPPDTPR